MSKPTLYVTRRRFLAAGAAGLAAPAALATTAAPAADPAAARVVTPPAGKRILLSCKLGMIAREAGGIVTDVAGDEFSLPPLSILAANPFIHPLMLRELNREPASPTPQ